MDTARAVVDRRAGAAHTPLDDLPGALQFGDPSVDVGQFGCSEGAAGGSAGGVVGEQQLYLIQCEAGGLTQPDDDEQGDDLVVVAALTADSGGGLYQSDPLVVAQCGRCDARLKRQFADRQSGGHGPPLIRSLT